MNVKVFLWTTAMHKSLLRVVNRTKLAILTTVPIVPKLNKMQMRIFCRMCIRRFHIMIIGYTTSNKSVKADHTSDKIISCFFKIAEQCYTYLHTKLLSEMPGLRTF